MDQAAPDQTMSGASPAGAPARPTGETARPAPATEPVRASRPAPPGSREIPQPGPAERGRTPSPPRRAGDRPADMGRTTEASLNGLAPMVKDVERARMRLGHDLEQLNYELRAQMGVTVEKLAWKAAVVGSSLLAVLGTQKALTALWKGARHSDPPENPADPQTGWGEALAWTLFTGATAAVMKIIAARAAAAGWERATGDRPPGLRA